MKHAILGAGFALATLAGAASASTVNVNYQEAGPFGTPNLSETVKIASTDYNGYARAGLFRLTGDSGFGDFLAFCVDLAQFLHNGDSYETPVALFSGATLDNMDRLFTSAYAGVDTSVEAAGFQVALWEIITDTANGFDLTAGDFSVAENAAVSAQADSYLSGLAGASTGGYAMTFLASDQGQDLVTVTPVPVPAAGLMLLAGLAGLGALRRKKTG